MPSETSRSAARDHAGRLAQAARALWRRAPDHDRDGADPASLCEPLKAAGLFVDALPEDEGGAGLATDAQAAGTLMRSLVIIGGCDLSAGRLFEGHINAVKLVFRYGDSVQRHALAREVRAGAVCGVWNAEASPGLTLSTPGPGFGAGQLSGAKIHASGLGVVDRPLVTARLPDGGWQMLLLRSDAPLAGDLAGWTVRGMRATATGTVNLDGAEIDASCWIGNPGDYYRSPLFKGGAWRFAAVQAGAALRLASLMRSQLRARGREADPHQRARIGMAAVAAETAELWVARAAMLAEDPGAEAATADAYVNLARLAVERAALEVIALAERGVGLSAFMRPDPIDRVARDLATYLRQPAPDAALEDAAAYLAADPAGPSWSIASDFPA